MRRPEKWPPLRSSSALHHAPLLRKVSRYSTVLLVCFTENSSEDSWLAFCLSYLSYLSDKELVESNIDCGSSSSEAQEGKSPSPSISRQASFDTDQVSKDFVDFLKNLQKPGREIHKQCRAFIVNMSSKKVCCVQWLEIINC